MEPFLSRNCVYLSEKMLFKVRVHPEAEERKVNRVSKDRIEVFIKEKAELGQANKAVCRALSAHFGLKGGVKILKGGKRENKIIEVNLGAKGQ